MIAVPPCPTGPPLSRLAQLLCSDAPASRAGSRQCQRIGNKKAVKAFLPELAKWLEAHDHPFEFTAEASLNLADDPEFLKLISQADFIVVFVGIESPDTMTLIAMRKKQNTRRSSPKASTGCMRRVFL